MNVSDGNTILCNRSACFSIGSWCEGHLSGSPVSASGRCVGRYGIVCATPSVGGSASDSFDVLRGIVDADTVHVTGFTKGLNHDSRIGIVVQDAGDVQVATALHVTNHLTVGRRGVRQELRTR